MSPSTDNWQQDLAEALEENQGEPVFEYSTMPQGASKQVSKAKNHHRPKWKRAELLLFATPLLLLCLLFVPTVIKQARLWSAPPADPRMAIEWVTPNTSAERLIILAKRRALRQRNAIAYEQYQRDLAAWRLRFVVIPSAALGVLFTVGITAIGIRIWKKYSPFW